MYPVSNDYLAAIKAPAIRSRITGTIGSTPFTDANILQGSFSITNQNSGSDSVQIGTVYIGELDITLLGLSLSRYSLNGVAITPTYELKLADDSYEDIPLGIYYIGEANYTRDGLEIIAYDVMSKLDKTMYLTTTTGTPYELASLMATECNVTLANTEEEFEAFANGDQTLALYTDGSDIETWRDFTSWLAQACGCYVTANRAGEVEFRQYNTTVVDTVSAGNRFLDASYSDYETRYTGIYVTNMADDTMSYYGLETDDALTYSLGGNPFLQYGLAEVLEPQRRAVLNALAVIDYVPFKVETVSNPMYDLGDVLSFPGGRGDAAKYFCVNKYTWTYHGSMELEGVGDNPALMTARSKVDKDIAGIINTLQDVGEKHLIFENAEAISVADGSRIRVLRLRFQMDKESYLSIDMEFLFSALATGPGSSSSSVDPTTGVVTVTAEIPVTDLDTEYYIDGEAITGHNPQMTCVDGNHVLRVRWDALSMGTGAHVFEVYFNAGDGAISIPIAGINAWVDGTGLGGEPAWDGTIEVEDTITPFTFTMATISDSAPVVTFQTPTTRTFSDTISALTFSMVTLTDSAETTLGIYVTPRAHVSTQTIPTSTTVWQATEDGQYVDSAEVTGMTGFTSATGRQLSYMASFDSGTTWVGWDGIGQSWITDLQMTYDTIHGITTWPSGSVMIRAIFDKDETCYGMMLEGASISI